MTGAQRAQQIVDATDYVRAIVEGRDVAETERPSAIPPREAFRSNRRGLQAWLAHAGKAVQADLERFADINPEENEMTQPIPTPDDGPAPAPRFVKPQGPEPDAHWFDPLAGGDPVPHIDRTIPSSDEAGTPHARPQAPPK